MSKVSHCIASLYAFHQNVLKCLGLFFDLSLNNSYHIFKDMIQERLTPISPFLSGKTELAKQVANYLHKDIKKVHALNTYTWNCYFLLEGYS